MKNLYHSLLAFTLLASISACKKNQEPSPANDALNSTGQTATLATEDHQQLKVVTIAGKYGQTGNADGDGTIARFNYPYGIDITDDGTLYIADFFGNSIRKITPANVVSTINIPKSNDGQTLNGPQDIVVQSDGTISILTYDLDWVIQHKVWIIKPNGEVLTPGYKTSPTTSNFDSYTYNDLVRDPYSNYLLLGGLFNNHSGYAYGLTERFQIKNNLIGTNEYKLPTDSLSAFDKFNPVVTNLFCGYNGLKYFVLNHKTIYKLTPSGLFTQIYRNLVFKNITAIVGNKDSRSFYIADAGAIKCILNDKLTYLAGPKPAHTGHDGVGSSADVSATKLALSKDESILYFTDERTVRKIYLK